MTIGDFTYCFLDNVTKITIVDKNKEVLYQYENQNKFDLETNIPNKYNDIPIVYIQAKPTIISDESDINYRVVDGVKVENVFYFGLEVTIGVKGD